jgi:predicted dithiol-disulfide oxidoreductase (DUF899 family)
MPVTDNLPSVVSRNEWFVARRELLTKEKELTDAHDRLAAERRRLPTVLVEPKHRATPLGLQVGGPATRLPDQYNTAP